MVTEVRARYSNGVFTILDPIPIDLEEGTEVTLSIDGNTGCGAVDGQGSTHRYSRHRW